MHLSSFRALQFIGTQRSGSNLLRVMLNQLPEISAPHPPHILQTMMPLLPIYGDLSQREHFAALIDDVCTLVELNPVSWHIQFNRAEVASRCEGNNLPQVVKAVYELKAKQKGAQFWCCKSMASIHYADAMEHSGLHPFYLHIYRDGRDVALSFRKAIVGEKHVVHLAEQWRSEQELSLLLCQQVGPERSIAVRYEDFILDPEKTVKMICNRIGATYRAEAMAYNQSEESRETASSGAMWSNLVKPVMRENTNKFLREMSPEDIALFESVAGETLVRLGYPLHSDPADRRIFNEEDLRRFDRENRAMKQQTKASAPAADLEKRAAQDAFIAQLHQRHEQLKTQTNKA